VAASAYPKRLRLVRRAQILPVLRKGRVHAGRECVVRLLANDLGHPRLGLSTPRQYGNAVRRNRFRRLAREAFRSLQAELGPVDVFVVPRRGLVTPTLEGLRADLRAAPVRAHAPRPHVRPERP
jgi:ribonuclease P protein component